MSRKLKISLVAGARPNFMKIAPIIRELEKHKDVFEWSLVHTGQHYDREMSDVFFEELGIPKPHYHLEAGGGSHAEQTAKIMVAYEKVLLSERPDLVMVVGDVNSTLACSIVAKKLNIRVAHVEAGLRSGDVSMPEEINRMVTDSISDLFFVTEESGKINLLREGHSPNAVHFVGHVMIDNLFYQLERLQDERRSDFPTSALKERLAEYGVVTLHRPSNVDNKEALEKILNALRKISEALPLIFSVHPRTSLKIKTFGFSLSGSIIEVPPLPYMEFLNLWKDAALVLTDSGGLQEETTALGVPCLTLRENTERPVTISHGSNILVGSSITAVLAAFENVKASSFKRTGRRPELWDGRAAERICAVISEQFGEVPDSHLEL